MPLPRRGISPAQCPATVALGFFEAVLAAINCCAVPDGFVRFQVINSAVSDADIVTSGADGNFIISFWLVVRISFLS